MLITDIQEMLQKVLNGQEDSSPDRPFDYVFMVGTPVSYLEKITNDNYANGNYLPVFINNLTGKYTADKTKELNASCDVTIYFPLELKNDITKITDYLEEMFVGEYRAIGSKRVLCNMSFPNLGGMEQIDVERFNEWVDNTYNVTFRATEPYMSLTFQLYLLTTGANANENNNYIYGKQNIVTLKMVFDEETYTSQIALNEYSVSFLGQTNTQQVLGDVVGGRSLLSTFATGVSLQFSYNAKNALEQKLKDFALNGGFPNQDIAVTINDGINTYELENWIITDLRYVSSVFSLDKIVMNIGRKMD